MNNKAIPVILVVALIIGAAIYYKQTTQTTSIELPGGKGISITTDK